MYKVNDKENAKNLCWKKTLPTDAINNFINPANLLEHEDGEFQFFGFFQIFCTLWP